MYNEYKNFISLPEISNYDIVDVTDIGLMFIGCISIISLPDI